MNSNFTNTGKWVLSVGGFLSLVAVVMSIPSLQTYFPSATCLLAGTASFYLFHKIPSFIVMPVTTGTQYQAENNFLVYNNGVK
jgi:hypothetical protein